VSDVDMVWAEGLPPELEERAHFAIAQNMAAAEAISEDPDSPLAKAAVEAAIQEGDNVRMCLAEFLVDKS
jgi:hypothetical protein